MIYAAFFAAGRRADFEAFPTRIRPKSGPESKLSDLSSTSTGSFGRPLVLGAKMAIYFKKTLSQTSGRVSYLSISWRHHRFGACERGSGWHDPLGSHPILARVCAALLIGSGVNPTLLYSNVYRRRLCPPVRLNHRYGSNRSPNPPIWDFLDLNNTGGLSCCFFGRSAPPKHSS
jgi:hypothetical protein